MAADEVRVFSKKELKFFTVDIKNIITQLQSQSRKLDITCRPQHSSSSALTRDDAAELSQAFTDIRQQVMEYFRK
ncbi:hypothetical protein O9993_01605 [Vibrio lentus]|nr:hypothetical protein [Vibrio lentus]